jgi:putative addiction module killer protein
MGSWILEFASELSFYLDKLSKEHLKSIAKELKLLELCGNNLKLPHSKALGRGLFELRERVYGYRIYYTFVASRKIILLNIGNKRTQQNDIKVARNRLSYCK